jgi:hypothetical protein
MISVFSRFISVLVLLPLLSLAQQKITWKKDGKEIVLIPAGSFKMSAAMNEPEDWDETVTRLH